MMNQEQIQKISQQQAQTKKNGAMIITVLGVVLTLFACYGFLDTQDGDYSIVLIFGSLISLFGFINLKE